jgi:hypothetical protein
MRTLPRVTGALIALTILIVGPTDVLVQADSSGQEAELWNRSRDCIAAPVRDAPFSAEAVTTWHPSANSGRAALRSTARYYRDRLGRVRVDFLEGMSPHRVIITLDADSRVAYLLDTVARTAIKGTRGMFAMIIGSGGCTKNHFVLPLSMSRFISFHASPLDEEPLGQRSIAGIQTTGTRFSMMLPASVTGMGRGERWVSSELQLVVYSRREDSEVGIVEHRLTKITRADSAAALFEVPADYVETVFPCMTWENPYSPNASGHGCGDRQ